MKTKLDDLATTLRDAYEYAKSLRPNPVLAATIRDDEQAVILGKIEGMQRELNTLRSLPREERPADEREFWMQEFRLEGRLEELRTNLKEAEERFELAVAAAAASV